MPFVSPHNGLDCSFVLSHYLLSFLHASVHSGSGHFLVSFWEDRCELTNRPKTVLWAHTDLENNEVILEELFQGAHFLYKVLD